jgi:hypothetical protein
LLEHRRAERSGAQDRLDTLKQHKTVVAIAKTPQKSPKTGDSQSQSPQFGSHSQTTGVTRGIRDGFRACSLHILGRVNTMKARLKNIPEILHH